MSETIPPVPRIDHQDGAHIGMAMLDWAIRMDEWFDIVDRVLFEKLEEANDRRKEGTDHDGPTGRE